MSGKGFLVLIGLIIALTLCIISVIPKVWSVGEVAYTHESHRVNPRDFSTLEAWYSMQGDNCRLNAGKVTVLEGPKNGLYLVKNTQCQGWIPNTWLHPEPLKK